MSKTAILECLNMLKAAYPRQELGDETITIYELALSDIDPDLLKQAILRLISRSVFFPTVAEIGGATADLTFEMSGLPTAYQAWDMCLHTTPETPAIVWKTAHAIGLDQWNLQRSTNLASDRARFIEAYGEHVSRLRNETTDLPTVKKYVALGSGNGQVSEKLKQLTETLSNRAWP